MALVGSVLVRFAAQTAEWMSGTQKLRADAKATTDAIASGSERAAKRSATAFKRFSDDLKSQFGKKSPLGETLELLKGGGAVIGISLLGRALGNASSKAIELRDALADGQISARQASYDLAKTIPLIGGFIEFGGNLGKLIDEAITGRVANEKRILEFQKARLAVAEREREVMKDLKNRLEAVAGVQRERARQRELAAAGSDFAKDRAAAAFEADNAAREIEQFYKRALAQTQDVRLREQLMRSRQDEVNANSDELLRRLDEINRREAASMKTSTNPFTVIAAAAAKASESIGGVVDRVRAAMEKHREWRVEAGRLFRESQTPMEEYLARVKEIEAHTGLGGLSQDRADRLKAIAALDLRNAMRPPEVPVQERRTSFAVQGDDKLITPVQQTAANTAQVPPLLAAIAIAMARIPGFTGVVSIPGT